MRASDRVYERLHREILEGDLRPGEILGEVEQSLRLGVSRTPLREALARLASDGLVSAHGGRGLAVAPVSPERVRELFELREALEIQASRLAARRRTPGAFERIREELRASAAGLARGQFSREEIYRQTGALDAAIDDAAGNAILAESLRVARAHLVRLRRIAQDDPERLRAATEEHLMIVEAIIEGSPEMAALATELHLRRSLASILAAIDEPRRSVPSRSFVA